MPLPLLPALLAATLAGEALALTPVTLARGLEHPWAVGFLPGGEFLVSERPGRLRVVDRHGQVGPPLAGLPAIAAGGQGGLLDVAVDHDFARNRRLYFCYTEAAETGRGSSTALASARLSADQRQLENVRRIFVQSPKVVSDLHFGCRIAEGRDARGQPDGTLFLTLGERYHRRDDAQTLDNHHGKIVRINKDGSLPAGNPFAGQAGARPEIWSLGHRNPQGAVVSPTGELWVHEHGPRGGDELNRIRPGANYGWPQVSFGRNYDRTPVGSGATAQAGSEAPMHYWTPSVAPGGLTFVTTSRYGQAWTGNLLLGSLKFGHLVRLELARPFGGPVVRESRAFELPGQRLRDVREGPDGHLYLLTDSADGQLIRLLPEGEH